MLVACLAALAPASVAFADDTPPAVLEARKHFESARAYYGQGAYREAIAELEAAHALDPAAKDLVFNLGVVHEKLADIDDALTWFRLFTTMDLTPQERERADSYIRRLEGAKSELEQRRAAQQQAARLAPPSTTSPTPPAGSAPAPPTPSERPSGKLDGWTIGALSVAGAGLAFGTVMAVRAKIDQPAPNFVTGSSDGTYTDLVNQQNNAHREAILADIGFGVGFVGAVAAAYLYFARRPAAIAKTGGHVTVSATPRTGGGAVFVGGSF
jgi:tetratricopeptide (TPR) repeat protein